MESQHEIDPTGTARITAPAQLLPTLSEVIGDIEKALTKLDAVGLFGKGAHLADALEGLRSYRDSLQNGANDDGEAGASS